MGMEDALWKLSYILLMQSTFVKNTEFLDLWHLKHSDVYCIGPCNIWEEGRNLGRVRHYGMETKKIGGDKVNDRVRSEQPLWKEQ